MTESTTRNYAKGYFLVFAFSLILYAFTAAPGALWQDSGMIQYRVWHNDILGGLGLALAHPLFYLIAIASKCIPVGEFGFRVTMVSAFFGAVTVANVFLLLRFLSGRIFPALVGALTLCLTWTFWRHCAIAETYTLYTAILTGELVLLFLYFRERKNKFLYAVAFLNGLSVSDHLFGSLALACYLFLIVFLLIRKGIRFRQVLLMGLLWAVGCLPYLVLIFRELIGSADFVATFRSALFGSYSSAVLNTGMNGRIVLQNFMFFGLSFPTPNVLLFFVGIFGIYKAIENKAFANLIIALTVIFFLFAFRYTVADRYAFFIPFYCLASVLIGLGAGLFVERFSSRCIPYALFLFAFVVIPVYFYAPTAAEKAQVSLGTKRKIPYRDDYTFFLRPWQRSDNRPENFTKAVFDHLDKNALIIADGTAVYPLWYAQQVSGLRKDVDVVSAHGNYKSPVDFVTPETLDGLLAEISVYVVSAQKGYCPDFILDNYEFIQSGPVYKIIKRKRG